MSGSYCTCEVEKNDCRKTILWQLKDFSGGKLKVRVFENCLCNVISKNSLFCICMNLCRRMHSFKIFLSFRTFFWFYLQVFSSLCFLILLCLRFVGVLLAFFMYFGVFFGLSLAS